MTVHRVRGGKTLGSGLTTSGTRHLYLSAKQRGSECVKSQWTITAGQAGWASFFFLLPWADHAGLSQFPTICKDLSASTASRAERREEGREQEVIYHCREMCCTQQGWLYSLLLLQPELQTLKKCRTCTSKISIHHRSPGTTGVAPLHVG